MTHTIQNFPEEMHKLLVSAAAKHKRSIDEEILYCINQTLDTESSDQAWLESSRETLLSTWNNPADDVFNALLKK